MLWFAYHKRVTILYILNLYIMIYISLNIWERLHTVGNMGKNDLKIWVRDKNHCTRQVLTLHGQYFVSLCDGTQEIYKDG